LQEELNPLEVSIEEIDKRVQTLVAELDQQPPNIKTLQHVLQGSALPRTLAICCLISFFFQHYYSLYATLFEEVNQGAMEICEVFLAKGEGHKYPQSSLDRLRESLRQFLKTCERAIDLNRSLITSDQIQFQRSIEEGFR